MNSLDEEQNGKNTNTITISKSFHDLSHLISQDMPVYPGDPQPEFEPFATIEKEKVNVTRIVIGSHTGTHVDAPKHFFADGNSVDREPLGKFIGEAVILDLSNMSIGSGITDSDLDKHSKIVKGNDILLFYTGTSEKWRKDEIIRNNFSYLEPSAAEWIVNHGIKCIGIDTLSVEKYGFKEGLTHKKLLSNNVVIIENLNSNLKGFVGKRVFLVCLPLMLKGIDGSPARVILFDIAD
jgi:arylformamidase